MSVLNLGQRYGLTRRDALTIIERLFQAGIVRDLDGRGMMLTRALQDITALELLQVIGKRAEESHPVTMLIGGEEPTRRDATIRIVSARLDDNREEFLHG